ncbi:MAG: S8 family peptidase, partial [Candidatus Kapaibacterium sp.]
MTRIFTFLVVIALAISTTFAFSNTPIAYHVNIESSNKNVMTVPVPKLEMGQYQINSIYVKTKSKVDVDGNRFVSDVLNKGFENVSISKLSKLASSKSNKVKGTPVEKLYVVEYAVGVDSYDMAQELMKNPEVEYAVPVFNRYTTEFTPNDPDISKQYHIDKNVKDAWDITKGSAEVIIAIVDSGTDWQHPDLLDNIYINPNEIPNNGIDDDNNGYIDDVNGWDFVGNLTFQQAINRQWKPDNDPKPSFTSNDHGTHVAGCASASTNNGIGIAAVGFNTKLMPIKCGSDNWNNGGTRGIFKGYEGIIYAAENGADIINCSWGGPGFNPAEQEIVNSITAMGVLIVASAGNDSENIDEVSFYPTGYNNILSVGSIQSNSRRSSFTNYGVRTDIYAPGTNIYATLPGNRYGNKSGTSMAGPVAAGLAALIKSIHPDWTPHQIAAQLRSTSDPVANVATSDIPLYFGKINALKAIQANANNFSDNKTKGMAISENDFNQNSTIDNYDEKSIQLKLINFLAPVSGVKLEFLAMDKYFDVLTSEVIVNGLTTLDTNDLELRIKLNDLNPWYDGFARVLIKYTAE